MPEQNITKPRLLVLARELPLYGSELEEMLFSQLSFRIADVQVDGEGALPYTPQELLDHTILGRSSERMTQYPGLQKGCELYVGITTPERALGVKTEDGKFDIHQLGERGYALAQERNIPAILLDYPAKGEENHFEIITGLVGEICDFVKSKTE